MRLIDVDNITALDIMHNVICDKEVAHKMLDFLQSQPTIQPQGIDKDRLIEVNEAMKELNYYRNLWYKEGHHTDEGKIAWHLNTILPFFTKLLEQPQTGWIPCSERLPETFEDRLVATSDGEVEMAWYNANYKRWFGSLTTVENVVAWQPLPQPYKESD